MFNGIPAIAVAALIFGIMGLFFIVLSGFKEGATIAQGFLVSMVLILLLAYSTVLGTDLTAAIDTIKGQLTSNSTLPAFPAK